MNPSRHPPPRQRRGLHALAEVELPPEQEEALRRFAASCGGDPTWRRRKLREARDLFALGQVAPGRMRVEMVDPRDDLHAVVALRTPVPCLPDPVGELVVEVEATLGLTYPRSILTGPLPGFACVQILSPSHVWHANVGSPPHPQQLCLAAQLPQGTRLSQIVVLAYAGLSMQSVMVDENDAAGVLNTAAARWWQSHLERTPLSREPFVVSAPELSTEREEVRP